MIICETAFADWRDAASILAGLPVYPERSRRASTVAGPSASVWPIRAGEVRLQATEPRSGAAAHGAVPSPQAPAWEIPQLLPMGTKNKSSRATRARAVGFRENAEPASPVAGGPARRRSGGRDALRGNENKRLRTLSNRNTNEGGKLATLSEPTTYHFLIATKMHFSEEKAKSDEKTNLVKASKTIVPAAHGR
jgi:hypothetical protein